MEEIIHTGIIRQGHDGQLQVEITDQVECSACHVKGTCAAGSSKDKIFPVDSGMSDFVPGESVYLHLSMKTAFKALFWAYILPLVILLVSIGGIGMIASELTTGLITLAVLAIYYIVLYLTKNFFNKEFSLNIKRLNHD
jgi:sigma-E factor negative regulatory protein RseC